MGPNCLLKLLLSQRPSLASQTESNDGTDHDSSVHTGRRDMEADVEKFLATLQTNIDKSEGDSDDGDEADGVSFSTPLKL